MKKLLAVWAVAVLAGAAASEDDASKKESERLQGRWRSVSFEADGKKASEDQLKQRTITYTGDRWTVREGEKVIVAGTQKLDPSKTPHEIDSLITEGEGKGITMLGIYEFKGDTFKVCFDPQGKERPRDFTPKAGRFVGVIRREKK